MSETGVSLGSRLCVFINSGFLCLSLCLRIVEGTLDFVSSFLCLSAFLCVSLLVCNFGCRKKFRFYASSLCIVGHL